MDRLDFVKSINHDNFENTIRNFFDQTMALYNLIGAREDIDISSKEKNQDIEFILLTNSEEEAEQLYYSIENHSISIYGKMYVPELHNGVKSGIRLALVDKKEAI